ncbi:MAG: hypothetical protein EA341_08245 [Mongoliibacter sp.]|uniref:hypothetical protein n=1 Tax=Mongoliibacter sp. TaxID=2022438 RepID=UPI0012F31117|nr:hypothetical protein [Mongoliibacter sp.]TVP50120.1 MAG: hypothetical protein EA341_08245 [Mongoliibacter sp.]
MNRFFIKFAALVSSGIFAYSYLREWVGAKWLDEDIFLLPNNENAPYFHNSESLYLRVIFIFGLLFTAIFIASAYFTIKKKEKMIMLCFVLSMFSIFVVMLNGAIK